ncbi:MAG: 2-C-methyl-D-erythritol 4-phosphate cytidylyltransferase [Steroidobacteraceae bacterium]
MHYWLVMPAAGSGQRFGGALPKQYQRLAGRAIIEWALAPFLADSRCVGIRVALAADDRQFAQLPAACDPRLRAVRGGARRADSVAAGIAACQMQQDDWVLVHDAARPCLTSEELDGLLAAAVPGCDGALLALPLTDTLKRAGSDGQVQCTEPREHLWRALTPQMFRAGMLTRALEDAAAAGRTPTDEAQAVEWLGHVSVLVAGSALNIKVTTPADLALAEAILRLRGGG